MGVVAAGPFSHRFAGVRSLLLGATLGVAGAGSASAYVGPSFLQIPDIPGGWSGEQHKNWLKADGNYWTSHQVPIGGLSKDPAYFSGPFAPRHGAGTLVIAIDKDDPVLPKLMDKCAGKTPVAELGYAESADLARGPFEIGPHPADVPEYFEYKLKNAQFSDCPVVPDAPQQAIVVNFSDIEWLNWHREAESVPIKLEPSPLKPEPASSKTKSFVLTWFAAAHDASDNQCPVMNKKPTEADYYALVPKDEAEKERAQLATKGGVNYENGQMGLRGPHRLNVTMAPGIVRDPGNAEPQTTVARGLDLDGDDGTGAPPAGVCKHKNYVSPDGRTGVDNQLFTAEGCIASFQGHKGFILQFANNQMHDGMESILIQISGIDNEQNDDDVDVALFYSLDPMRKSGTGGQVLADYTFRVSDNPQYAYYATRLHGRIVNGVVITDPVNELDMNLGMFGTPRELKLADARMRLELLPDGTIKGVLGGYMDWRTLVSRYVSSTVELYHGFQVPGLFNALRRGADGMKDPITGACNGISSAYDIEGIPAFIAPAQHKVAQNEARGRMMQADARGEKAQ